MNKLPKEVLKSQKAPSARAVVKYLRISPRKMRLVIDTVRFQHPEKALAILANLNKKAARMVEKIVKTAVANAKVLGMDESTLRISDIRADGGPVMKRFMERSMGRANRILKRTTHLSVILTEGGTKNNTQTSSPEAESAVVSTKKTVKSEAAKSKKKIAAAKS